jgi:hypothetical protein
MINVPVPVLNPIGIQLLCITVLLLLVGGAGLDFYLELTNREPLGQRIRKWAERYPGFMAGLALVFGMMVGHFFFSLPGQ